MLWLVYQMWSLILLAFAGGVIAGWIIRSRSDEMPERPMLETLEATVVAPVDSPAPNVPEPKPEPIPASAPDPAPKAEADAKPAAEVEPKSEPKPEPETASAPPPKPRAQAAAKPATKTTKPKAPASPPPKTEAPADDLTKIKGLGPKAAAALNGEGVTRFDQVATWKKADVEKFDALINGRGRITRDEWVKQAKSLAKG